MFLRTILIWALLSCVAGYSQRPKLSMPEKMWILWHPIAAIKVKKITGKCYTIYNKLPFEQRLDKYENGGRMDAFRHAFFMAAYAQRIRTRKIRKLGLRHEQANYKQFTQARYEEGEPPDSLASVMDLRNNEVGFVIGNLNKK